MPDMSIVLTEPSHFFWAVLFLAAACCFAFDQCRKEKRESIANDKHAQSPDEDARHSSAGNVS